MALVTRVLGLPVMLHVDELNVRVKEALVAPTMPAIYANLDALRKFFNSFQPLLCGANKGRALDLVISGVSVELGMLGRKVPGLEHSPVNARWIALPPLSPSHISQSLRSTPMRLDSSEAVSEALKTVLTQRTGEVPTDTDAALERLVWLVHQLSGGVPRLTITILRCVLQQCAEAGPHPDFRERLLDAALTGVVDGVAKELSVRHGPVTTTGLPQRATMPTPYRCSGRRNLLRTARWCWPWRHKVLRCRPTQLSMCRSCIPSRISPASGS